MATLITSREPDYRPVSEDKEDTEASRLSTETADETLSHERRIYSSRRSWLKLNYLLSLAVCLTLYSWIVVAITNKLSSRLTTASFAGSTNVYPDSYQDGVSEYFDYVPKVFTQNEGVMKFFGEPSQEIDLNWHELLEPQNIGLPADYMEQLGRLDEGIQLSDGTYYASFMVFHHLHCLKNLYHSLYPAHYGLSGLTPEEQKTQNYHLSHCLHLLRQAVMCQADTTIVTMLWNDNNKRPVGNFTTPHRCVRWHRFLEYVEPHSFDGFSENLVHPKFGNPFSKGKSELDLFFDRNSSQETKSDG